MCMWESDGDGCECERVMVVSVGEDDGSDGLECGRDGVHVGE